MLTLVTMNSGGNGGRYKPFTTDPDNDPEPGGQPPTPPNGIELPFTRRHHASSTADESHLRAA